MSGDLVGLGELEEALRGRGLAPSEYGALLRYGHPAAFRGGRPLGWQDDAADRAWLVVHGTVGALKRRNGAADLALPASSRGDWVALAELVSRAPLQADYGARDDAVCLGFSALNLAALRARPACADWLLLCLSRSHLAIQSQLAEGDSASRLISWLLSRRRSVGILENPVIAATQAGIAADLGLSRETVNKKLGDLAARGLVSLGRAEIGVPDWEALEDALGD